MTELELLQNINTQLNNLVFISYMFLLWEICKISYRFFKSVIFG